MIVGIDLGTTNSLIGRIEKGRPRLFVGSDGKTLVPSVVSFSADGKALVGAEAKQRGLGFPQSTVSSSKRFLAQGKQDVAQWMALLPFDFSRSTANEVLFQVGERTFSPTEIAAEVLKHLKKTAEDQSEEKVSKAVVTVPAYFNDAQRQATKLAGELAGLEVVRIVNEPTAACLAYGLDKRNLGTVAVFDLGGGTFDISVLRVTNGVFEVLATGGDTALGGDDFDHVIVEKLAPALSESLGDWQQSAEARALTLAAAEQLKRELSETETAIFAVDWNGKHFEQPVTRSEMENWIAPVLERVAAPCLNCLKDSGVEANQISDVLLVGGSTKMPLVRKRVREIFGRDPICTLNPEEVVAVGAAVQANILAGQMGEMLLLDVIPLSLGIETMGGVVSKILHRNSPIPTSASQSFTTHVDGQISVDIHVLQGERELVKDNRSLARFQLSIPPLPAGIPKIEVEFIIDANGILNVRAMELRTMTQAAVTVNPTYGLNDTQVEKMLSDSFDHAEADFSARFLIEARTEADGLIRATEKSLKHNQENVADGERSTIEQAIETLRTALNGSDYKVIRAKMEVLNDATRPLAETLLNAAVRNVMKDMSLESRT